MATRLVKISLATKFRLMLGAAVLGIIAAALVVPWYFMELLAEQGLQRAATEIMRLRLNEFLRDHPQHRGTDLPDSQLPHIYALGDQQEARRGPFFTRLKSGQTADEPLDSASRQALRALRRGDQDIALVKSEDDRGRPLYRYFRPVRADRTCLSCHASASPNRQFDSGQLVAMIDVTLPGTTAMGHLVWWTRGAFVVGGVMAVALALILFTVITQRLVLRPVRRLRDMADKVADGDLGVRSTIKTGDELQRLGESFNEMLMAIAEQHEKLRSANRALDLKLNELAEANVTLFKANSVKNEFLANVSHELRTPLNSIIGFADLLGDSTEEKIRRYGQNISSSAKNLLSMINALLDSAKIESGKADVRLDKVSVTDICQTLLALMKPLADKKQLELRSQLQEDMPLVVTDAGKLQQILYNFLSNAIKFTQPGGQVVVSSGLTSTQRGEQAVEEAFISVADTGPGIAEADQQHIFEKFYQVDRSLTKESSGTGLGLSISKDLTSLLGGRLTLKSEPGHGAEFTVFLPVTASGSL